MAFKWNSVWNVEINDWNGTGEYGILASITFRHGIILTVVYFWYKNSRVVSFLTELWSREPAAAETLECTSKSRLPAPPCSTEQYT